MTLLPATDPRNRKTWTVQVQAQFEVEAHTAEDACEIAIELAVEQDPALWAAVILAPAAAPHLSELQSLERSLAFTSAEECA